MAKKRTNISNFHMQYSDVTSQHWHPDSQRFAGADNLVTALEHDWIITECVQLLHWYAGMRSVKVYQFHLERKKVKMQMPVIDNPYVQRFLAESGVKLTIKEDIPS